MTIELCPNCKGQKWVQKPPWIAGDQNTWSSTNAQYDCPTCNGKGYISVDNEDEIVDNEDEIVENEQKDLLGDALFKLFTITKKDNDGDCGGGWW